MSTNDNANLTVVAWNTEGQDTSFDCDSNALLYRYFQKGDPIPVLLLVDEKARWNQELENVYLVSCQMLPDGKGQHYTYELRPDPE